MPAMPVPAPSSRQLRPRSHSANAATSGPVSGELPQEWLKSLQLIQLSCTVNARGFKHIKQGLRTSSTVLAQILPQSQATFPNNATRAPPAPCALSADKSASITDGSMPQRLALVPDFGQQPVLSALYICLHVLGVCMHSGPDSLPIAW